MFGTKPKHKVFSAILMCLASATLANKVFEVYDKSSVTIDLVKDIGLFLVLVSIALFPEFFSSKASKASKAFKLDEKSKIEKISGKLLTCGFLLVGIAVVAETAL